jgi:hypothetical protein
MASINIQASQLKHANGVARMLGVIAKAYAFHINGAKDDKSTETGKVAMRKVGQNVLREIAKPGAKVPFHNLDGMLSWIENNKQISLPVVAQMSQQVPSDFMGACTVEAWRHLHATIVARALEIQALRKVETDRVHTCAEAPATI